ncbi:MAG: phosphatidylserine decarboxylase [Alphaproteobacteria bacterium]|nr:phosphatidylserine decarboxylase [Alphaproteobacteria bacterium]
MSDQKEENIFQLMRKVVCVPVHPAGYPFIFGFAILAFLMWQIGDVAGCLGVALVLWCTYFFRNPPRATPVREGLIVSPADGMVQMIVKAPLPPELDGCKADDTLKDDPLFSQPEVTRVSVFLNVFDVHVNRIPADGTVKKVVYHPGKFLNASLDKASVENERSTVLMTLAHHAASIAFVQIAGLVARRIICQAKAGDESKAGQVYGLIRFGSRVDIFLPPGVAPLVAVGQRMVGGETVIADATSSEAARVAEVRG